MTCVHCCPCLASLRVLKADESHIGNVFVFVRIASFSLKTLPKGARPYTVRGAHCYGFTGGSACNELNALKLCDPSRGKGGPLPLPLLSLTVVLFCNVTGAVAVTELVM